MADNISAVTDAEFDAQVLKADKPVLVDFWAEWWSRDERRRVFHIR